LTRTPNARAFGNSSRHDPDLLLQELGGEEGGACNIASGAANVRDEAQLHGVATDAEYDRNSRSGCLGDRRCRAAERDEDRRVAGDQIRHKCGQLVILVRGADIQYDVVSDDIPHLAKTIAKCGKVESVSDTVEHTDHRDRDLLRARRERPCGRRAAEQRDELASF
jgi:hypothetical protein